MIVPADERCIQSLIPSLILVLSVCYFPQNGQFQLHEPGGLVTQSSMMVYQVNTQGTLCTTFDISATCQSMVFGDAGGIVYL